MGFEGISKALNAYVENIEKWLQEASKVAVDPNHTLADVDKLWGDLKDIAKDSSNDFLEEAHEQVKERMTNRLLNDGWKKEDAEKWLDAQLKQICDKALNARKEVPKLEKTAHSAWLKLTGFVGGTVAIVAGTAIFSAITSGPTSEQQQQRKLNEFFDRQDIARRQRELLEKIAMSAQELDLMTAGLRASSAPEVVMPEAIAVIASMPAVVVVSTPDEKQEIPTTVGQVYQSSPPQLQEAMEKVQALEEPPIHARTGSANEDHPSRLGHKDFTVNAGFASVHIHY